MASCKAILLFCCWLLGCGGVLWGMKPSPASPQMPFSFVENHGQTDVRVRAIGAGPRFKAWFEDDGILLQQGAATVYVGFEGAAPRPAVTLVDPTGATANYLRGSDPRKWQTHLPLFNAVHYEGVWPGVALTFRQDNSRMEVEYELAPGAAIGEIRLRFSGNATIESDGSLLVRSSTGEFRERKPVFYQESSSRPNRSYRQFPRGPRRTRYVSCRLRSHASADHRSIHSIQRILWRHGSRQCHSRCGQLQLQCHRGWMGKLDRSAGERCPRFE